MYYITRQAEFHSSGAWSTLMANPFLGSIVSYITVLVEVAFPAAILSSRAWVRKAETLMVEGMHLGIIVTMGLVCFGIVMIGADCTALRDDDYHALYALALRALRRNGAPNRATAGALGGGFEATAIAFAGEPVAGFEAPPIADGSP